MIGRQPTLVNTNKSTTGMYIVIDKRINRLYRTKYKLWKDKINHLNTTFFLREKTITDNDIQTNIRCMEKWSFIKMKGKIDGRTKECKRLPYFSWVIVCNEY